LYGRSFKSAFGKTALWFLALESLLDVTSVAPHGSAGNREQKPRAPWERHILLNTSALLDQSPLTTYQFRRPVTAPTPLPAFATTRPHPNCACRGGNSKSLAHLHPTIANSRESSASATALHLQCGTLRIPKARAHQSAQAFRRRRVAFSVLLL